ncbi:MAG: hypothetical protein CM1200mP10_28670 [Candidatus Neomarinimicrobiota bacterium]|nr:MAG: hypothetical protein CM1200mP10_28670 [Candidatus Neomarinimicrobiota bacterium]
MSILNRNHKSRVRPYRGSDGPIISNNIGGVADVQLTVREMVFNGTGPDTS